MTTIKLVLCTCPDRKAAEEIATQLVDAGLAACINLLPGITSIYRWQGKIEHTQEVLLFIKTSHARLDELQKALVALHPYDVPEVIILGIEQGHQPYLEWVEQCVISS
ncbi:MAG: divalent-cation tolerance protein CutA [Gammaproteobacteria bacterium]|nr:divalent-cation tolerance protein CutA [Gammaproteobacteria bacterium]MBU1653674.1 divalent-cation tolerance protein CutA [Gammaproteobacteria bacterium]MBU1962504.1 divalent-cation tolerance protein CutA [Gammaproteobacteria bacterium]